MKALYYIIMALLFGVFFMYERTEMLMLDISDAVVGNYVNTVCIAGCVLLSIMAILFSKRHGTTNLTRNFCTLMIFIYILSIIHSFTYPLNSRNQYGSIIMPLLMFIAISRIEINDKSTSFVLWSMTFGTLLLVYTFYTEYISINLSSLTSQSNASYYELYFLPFLLCHERKIVRNIAIAIILFVVLFSLKRGGFLALMLALAVYFYVLEFIKGNRIKIGNAILLVIAAIMIASIVAYLNENLLGGMLYERLENIEESGGSGRADIYAGYLSLIEDSSLENILFGRGWTGSIRDSDIGYTCHNDFLESFIDFGVFGFILFVSLFVALIRHFLYMVKLKHKYAPAMGASIALVFVNTMVSHILIYTWYMTIFSLFWGFIVASTRQEAITDFKISK